MAWELSDDLQKQVKDDKEYSETEDVEWMVPTVSVLLMMTKILDNTYEENELWESLGN